MQVNTQAMMLKGRKNHYDVKLLIGYGASISLKNKKVCLKGRKDVFAGEQIDVLGGEDEKQKKEVNGRV